MDNDSNFKSPQEEILYKQIRSYRESQRELNNIIENNFQAEFELYFINDEWLNQWKQYSCYDEIKISSLNNIDKWREIRIKNNADQIIIGKTNNKDLFQNNNNYITINNNSYFHFMNKKCFYVFFKDSIDNNEIFKMKFSSFNNKIIGQLFDKILVLYKNNESLNLLMFILEDFNNPFYYNHIKESNMREYLLENNVGDNIETWEIDNKQYNYRIKYINKSHRNMKMKSKEFKNLIKSLINYDDNFNSFLNQNNNNTQFFILIKISNKICI